MIKSEKIAQEFFGQNWEDGLQNFTIKDVHEKKQHCDIILSLIHEGEEYFVKVEVKSLHERLLKPQLNMMQFEDGLIVYVDTNKEKVNQICTKEDLVSYNSTFETIEHIKPIWRK